MDGHSFVDQLDFFNQLSTIIDTKVKEHASLPVIEPYESQTTENISTALSKAQGEFNPIASNQENPYFKTPYADLDALELAIRPILAKQGLSYTQQTKIDANGVTMLVTRLRHGSEWIESRARIMPPKDDLQTYGSTMAFMKRDQLSNLLGISWGHMDDDAERAMAESRAIFSRGTALNTKYNPKEKVGDNITKEQIEELEYELAEYPDLGEMVMNGLKIQSLADMPKSKYMTSITRIREIKQLRNEGRKI